MISEKLKRVILKELRLKDFPFTDATHAYEVPGWDSLNHIRIICAIEKEYAARFKTDEILQLQNMGDLQSLVANSCKKAPDA
jgi:acyl carrier protein